MYCVLCAVRRTRGCEVVAISTTLALLQSLASRVFVDAGEPRKRPVACLSVFVRETEAGNAYPRKASACVYSRQATKIRARVVNWIDAVNQIQESFRRLLLRAHAPVLKASKVLCLHGKWGTTSTTDEFYDDLTSLFMKVRLYMYVCKVARHTLHIRTQLILRSHQGNAVRDLNTASNVPNHQTTIICGYSWAPKLNRTGSPRPNSRVSNTLCW